ncbi:MAG: homogentisate 1,2-dioxygenase domain-containing protein, partial [Mycobacteriales bacterium]
VFDGSNFVICNFVPRKVDYHQGSIPIPYNHANVDSDEVMFYCAGDYEARRGSGIEQGSISVHPGGFTHGPQPGAAERSIGAEYFDELAVMVDTFRPLDICPAGLACEDPGYAWTWSGAHRDRAEGAPGNRAVGAHGNGAEGDG